MISHDREFVFVHIPKTGGSSIYQALGGNEKDDPQHGYCTKLNLPLQHLTASELLEHDFLSPSQFSRYFKFCFVRNPWDLVVSEWRWRMRQKAFPRLSPYHYVNPSLKSFLLTCRHFRGPIGHKIRRHLLPQFYFTHNSSGEQLLDYIARFENMAEDFAYIRKRLNLTAELLHLNDTKNRKSDYRVYYNEETYELVRKLYAIDIERFGYQF
jgi:hypothetical protein